MEKRKKEKKKKRKKEKNHTDKIIANTYIHSEYIIK